MRVLRAAALRPPPPALAAALAAHAHPSPTNERLPVSISPSTPPLLLAADQARSVHHCAGG